MAEQNKELGFFGKIGMSMLRGFSRLPMGFLYVLADCTCFLMYTVIGYRKKVVRDNLKLAFPNKDEKERRQIERAFYKHLNDYFFETIKGLTISDEELKRRYVIRNPELAQKFADEGRSVFLYGAHIGNWEWLTALPLYFPKVQIQTFYQPQENHFADHMTLAVRTRRNIIAVESQKGFRYMYKCMQDGFINITLTLGDQCPHSGAPKFWLPFMGQDTPFLVGPEHIARRINQVLIYPSYVAYERGHYEVELRLIEANPNSIEEGTATRRFAAFLEDDLHRLPQLWLWSHRRWKLKHEDFPDSAPKEKHAAK